MKYNPVFMIVKEDSNIGKPGYPLAIFSNLEEAKKVLLRYYCQEHMDHCRCDYKIAMDCQGILESLEDFKEFNQIIDGPN